MNEISNAISNAVTKAIDKVLDDLMKQIQKEMPNKVKAIQQEVLQSYIRIAQTELVEYFYKWYGPNFDVNSLKSSITCYLNGLYPNFHYDKNNFIFKQSLKKNTRKFNENREYDDDRLDFDNSEQEDNYDNDSSFNEEFEELGGSFSEEIDDFEPYNKKFIGQALPNLDRVYMGAKAVIQEKFSQQFEKVIKPRILNKYSVKIK